MKRTFSLGLPLLPLLLLGYFLISLNSFFVYNAVRDIAYPITALWSAAEQFTLVSIFIGLYSLGSTLFAPYFGELSDQHGRRKAFLLSLLIWSFGYIIGAIGATVFSIAILFFGHLVTGSGDSFRSLALASIADKNPDPLPRMRAFGIFSSSDGILAGIFYLLDFSVRHPEVVVSQFPTIPFLTSAAIGILVWFIFYLNFEDSKTFQGAVSFRNAWTGFSQVFRVAGIKRLYLLYFLGSFPFLTLEEVHGAYLFSSEKISRGDVFALYLTMSAGWFAASCFLFPWAYKKIGNKKTFFYAFLFYFLYWAILPLFGKTLFLYSIPLFTGVALGLIWPSTLGMVSLLTPSHLQGKAQSIGYMILAGCALIGPMLLRDDLLGMPNFLYFFILVCTASGVLVSLSLKRSNEKE